MDVLGTPTAEQWPKMVSMPDYTHWLVLRRTDSYVVGRVFFSNVSASPLQCISGMWNAPVLRRGFICLSDCCGTILNNGSLRLMRFRIHGSMRTHCQSEREFKRCFMYTDKISLFPIKSPYPPARVVQNDTQPQASTSSRTRKPRV